MVGAPQGFALSDNKATRCYRLYHVWLSAEDGGYILQPTGKSLWHPNLHFLSSYQRKLRELLISIASLSKGCTSQNCLTLMANHILKFGFRILLQDMNSISLAIPILILIQRSRVHDYSDKFNGCCGPSTCAIVDGAVLKGKLYVLTSYAEIGVLNLNSMPYITLLELLAYDEHLLVINGLMNGIGIMKEECQVYELNFMKMEWIRIQNFTDQALFLDFDMGSRFSNMTIWR
ncbi:hypothetical protein CFP56_038373 [Quercus suber]|uniref:KIB1-4 beta-propeller domain-containing protein n=1 Tax=Quercus suber TaxID=58331 RepID=A0AAW0J214_QUESU